MTARQMSEVSGVSVDTVNRKIKEMYPDAVQKGRSTRLSQTQAITVMSELRKKNFVEPTQSAEVPTQNAEVPTQNAEVVTKADLATFGAAIVSEVIKQFLPIIQNQTKQIEFVQDYFSIKGYASKLRQQINFSDALTLGRLAGKISREREIEIRKVDDEQYGSVNSYHLSVLQEVFQI